MKFALFLGCTIPARGRNYELATRKVAAQCGLELVDLPAFICCGFPMKNADQKSAMRLGAYNLALAEAEGLDVCTLCSSCTSALTETAHRLHTDTSLKAELNETLSKVGLQYKGTGKVRHLARILHDEIGLDEVKKHFRRDLADLSIAIHYGCHYLKPSAIYEGFDDPEDPATLHDLVNLTGARVAGYKDANRCCGGPLLPVDEKTALAVAREKLEDIAAAKADAICLVCPFCAVMYDGNQKGIEAQFGARYDIPALYLPQILGLAMGFDRKELGLNMNVVKTKSLLARLSEGA